MAPNLSIIHNPLGKGLCRLNLPLDMPEADFAIAFPRIPAPSPLALRVVALMKEEADLMVQESETQVPKTDKPRPT